LSNRNANVASPKIEAFWPAHLALTFVGFLILFGPRKLQALGCAAPLLIGAMCLTFQVPMYETGTAADRIEPLSSLTALLLASSAD